MFYDLSVALSNETRVYPSDPAVSFNKISDIDHNDYNITSIRIGSHTGTHVDLPLHCIKDGANTATMPLDRFFGEAVFFDVPYDIDKRVVFDGIDTGKVGKGDIVIIRTGWEDRSGLSEFFEDYPYFGIETAKKLIALGVKAVGTDIPSVDRFGSSGEIHKMLLSEGIVIIEGLINLSQLVGKICFFSAVPLKIVQGDGSPVRAYAIL
ncbi:MAG: cyclase family protein [Saccharofermentanales bacterium]